MSIFFTADTHFGHEGILTHQPVRAGLFPNTDIMDATIIDQFNAVLGPEDILYHLGDFCWKASLAGHYRQRLKVRELHIIRGNHDSSSLRSNCSSFDMMLCCKFRVPGFKNRIKIHLCHYPMLSWDALHHGGLHLYGHSHGGYETELNKIYPGRYSMDVGIDHMYKLTGTWQPMSLDFILGYLNVFRRDLRVPGPFEAQL